MRQIKLERRKSVSFSDSDAGRSRIVYSLTHKQRTDWFDLGFCGSLPVQLQTTRGDQRERAVNSSSARALAASAQLQVQTSQIGFNLCFALPIIDPQSCVANGNE